MDYYAKYRRMLEVEFVYMGNAPVPDGVRNVRFHPSVTEIDDDAFYNSQCLVKVVFNEGLRKIGKRAFAHCRWLKSIILPSTLTEVDERAFSYCTNLKDVVLNEGLQRFGNGAFYYCSSLQNITLPSTITVIRADVFCGCTNLKEAVFNEGMNKIGLRAFQNCTSLQSITLPSTIVAIFGDAFRGCSKLREVLLKNERMYQVEENAFADCTTLGRLKFPILSIRLGAILKAGHREIENKMNDIRGYDATRRVVETSRDGDLFVFAALFREDGWGEVRESLDKVIGLIAYYEMKVATTIFELALWKAKMDTDETNPVDRDACRIEVPGPVKDAILQYLSYK